MHRASEDTFAHDKSRFSAGQANEKNKEGNKQLWAFRLWESKQDGGNSLGCARQAGPPLSPAVSVRPLA